MPKTTAFFIFILLIVTTLLGYNYFFKPFVNPNDQVAQEVVIPDELSMVQEPGPFFGFATAQDVLASMSPAEKIAQLILVPVSLDMPVGQGVGQAATQAATQSATQSATQLTVQASNQTNILQEVATFKPGGITFFGADLPFQETTQTISQLQEQIPFAPIFAVDHEGGTVQRLAGEGFTILPSWRAQCALELDQAQELWQQSALELSQAGITMILAPMVDFATTNSVLGSRICSSDTQKVVEYGLSMSDVFYQAGIQPVFKHFPGIGKTKVDLHNNFDTVQIGPDEASVYQDLLKAPKKYTTAVMVSHVGVENQFATVPCSLSDTCISELKNADPSVLIVSDALEMKSATSIGRTLQSTIELAIRAGNHILVFGPDVTVAELAQNTQELALIYEDSSTFRAAVDRAVTRVLEYKYSMMILEDESIEIE